MIKLLASKYYGECDNIGWDIIRKNRKKEKVARRLFKNFWLITKQDKITLVYVS